MISTIAEEYRANAKQCLAWAEAARDTENREAFYELAATWAAAAVRLDQSAAERSAPQPYEVMLAG